MTAITFLFDVDNTLLDHDRVTADLRRNLDQSIGPDRAKIYWELFEKLRNELGYADYLGALQAFRTRFLDEPDLLAISQYLLNYPFANRLFPASLDAVAHARQTGPTVILSDGDVVFQPQKIFRSGLFEVFQGNVLIYIHKEQELASVEARYPSEHYVMLDDKLRILTAMKAVWGERLTTVFVRQGHYAKDPAIAQYPPADLTIDHIGDFQNIPLSTIAAHSRTTNA
ncbi:MAG TPA: haloacid dehalogenase [Solibacterales bacterium]|nr:haloacid dehalogenase [Bryobacterales bacterium]